MSVGTRKGAFFLESDAGRRNWKLRGPAFLGQVVNHVVLDPRDGRTMLAAAKPGHIGPTVFRSRDYGKTWTEAARPPAFHKRDGGLSVDLVFWLTPSLASEPGVWYAGSVPPGLFRSEDGGNTWDPIDSFNEHQMRSTWLPDQPPPDGSTLHSINVDPRNARHLLFGVSAGGVFESWDRGATWAPYNKGVEIDFLPEKFAEYGQDPHCVRFHPLEPDVVWQQNHCGIYRIDRRSETSWTRIGRNMPKAIGDIGFGIAVHPRDPRTAWVFPMDGSTVWPRTSIGGKPALYVTRDGGRKWKRQDLGLPKEQAWFTVKRQALANDRRDPVGLYFGTTSGEIWASANEGEKWRCLAAHLPHIYSVELSER